MEKKRILLIDDSDMVLEMTSDILVEAGYEVVTARNSIEANQHIFSRIKPNLILLDVMMPMLQGDKTVEILRKTDFTSDIPIVYLSSKSKEELEKMVAETKVAGYLCKPFTDDKLLETVSSYAR